MVTIRFCKMVVGTVLTALAIAAVMGQLCPLADGANGGAVVGVRYVAAAGDFMITGRVTDAASGQPIPGAAAFIEDSSLTTFAGCDDGGYFRLLVSSPYITQTNVTVGAQAVGYATRSVVVPVADLSAQPQRDFALEIAPTPTPTPTRNPNWTPTPTPPCANTFKGIVVNVDTNRPIQGAVVRLEQHNVSSTTDSTGAYSLVFPFYYSKLTRVSAAGYRDVVVEIPHLTVSCQSWKVNFQLAPVSAPPATPTPSPTPSVVPVASDDFESAGWSGGAGWASAWSHSGDSSVTTSGVAHGGRYHLRLRSNTGVASRMVNMAGRSAARLQFWWKAYSFEAGETAAVEVYDGTWHTVLTVADGQDNNVYQYADLDLSAYRMVNTFQVRVRANLSNIYDYFYVDDVRIVAAGTAVPTPTPPPPTITPTPGGYWEYTVTTGDATNVTGQSATLHASGCVNKVGDPGEVQADGSLYIEYWKAGDPANKVRTGSVFIYGGQCQSLAATVTGLEPGTTYQYQAYNVNYAGEIKSFTTLPSGTPTHTPMPTPTPTRTPTPTATQSAGTCAVDYAIQNDWGTGATVNVTIRNNSSSAINGWTLAWTFPGNQQITNLWNGTYTQSGASVSVKNASWNGTIPANGGTVGFGFNLSYSGTNGKPSSFVLNGMACQSQ